MNQKLSPGDRVVYTDMFGRHLSGTFVRYLSYRTRSRSIDIILDDYPQTYSLDYWTCSPDDIERVVVNDISIKL